jgi:tRNA (cmo5U34)-methyltransferase
MVSGLISPHAPPAQIIARWLEGDFTLLYTPAMLEELEDVLNRARLKTRPRSCRRPAFCKSWPQGRAEFTGYTLFHDWLNRCRRVQRMRNMNTPLEQKSTLEEIRLRFDGDVERFSDLNTGQATTVIDASLSMALISRAAVACTANIGRVLDIGCGAGNNTLKLLQLASPFDCDLIDLSLPMLQKAQERISAVNTGKIRAIQGDFRRAKLPKQGYDVILAAAILHHLRDENDWLTTFRKLYRLTAPGGSVWVTDLVSHEIGPVQAMMWQGYGEYLSSIGGDGFKSSVFAYIDKEDSPRPVTYQLELLRKVGFDHVELLHKNSCFAAFGAIKAG